MKKLTDKLILAVPLLIVLLVVLAVTGALKPAAQPITAPPAAAAHTPAATQSTAHEAEYRALGETPALSESPTAVLSAATDSPDTAAITVYITESGEKYHCFGCQYLRQSCIPIDLSKAVAEGYTPCSKCNPPS